LFFKFKISINKFQNKYINIVLQIEILNQHFGQYLQVCEGIIPKLNKKNK